MSIVEYGMSTADVSLNPLSGIGKPFIPGVGKQLIF